MKRLILFRHAETEGAAETGKDFDRALTERGRDEAALAGRLLSGAGFIPDLVLVSAARRAMESWAQAAPSLPDAHVHVRPDLYEAPAKHLQDAARSLEASTVMIVGHNPSIQTLALELGERSTLIDAHIKAQLGDGFPTGASAVFEFEPGRTGCLGLFIPSEHRGGAGA